MWRYLALATLLVLGTVAVVAGVQRAHAPLRVASVQSTGSPSPPRRQAGPDYNPGAVSGVAPWALDALLDCFHHVREYDGPWKNVLAHLPRDARRLQDQVLESRDCTLRVGPNAARVTRGAPANPDVNYFLPGSVALYVRTAAGTIEAEGVRDLYVVRRDRSHGRIEHLRTAAPTKLGPAKPG